MRKNGIYGYWDNKKQYVAYIGKDSNITQNRRHKEHLNITNYNRQEINKVIQNNPNRYQYFVLCVGSFSKKAINELEKEAIKIFKTYKYDYPQKSVFNFTRGGEESPSLNPNIAKKISNSVSGEKNHFYGKHHSKANKIKMSKARNTSGYYNVYKEKSNRYKQGFIWTYQYQEDGKQKRIRSVDFSNLKKKVIKKNLPWYKLE